MLDAPSWTTVTAVELFSFSLVASTFPLYRSQRPVTKPVAHCSSSTSINTFIAFIRYCISLIEPLLLLDYLLASLYRITIINFLRPALTTTMSGQSPTNPRSDSTWNGPIDSAGNVLLEKNGHDVSDSSLDERREVSPSHPGKTPGQLEPIVHLDQPGLKEQPRIPAAPGQPPVSTIDRQLPGDSIDMNAVLAGISAEGPAVPSRPSAGGDISPKTHHRLTSKSQTLRTLRPDTPYDPMPEAPTMSIHYPNQITNLGNDDLQLVRECLQTKHRIDAQQTALIRSGFWLFPLAPPGEKVAVIMYCGEAIYLNTKGDAAKPGPQKQLGNVYEQMQEARDRKNVLSRGRRFVTRIALPKYNAFNRIRKALKVVRATSKDQQPSVSSAESHVSAPRTLRSFFGRDHSTDNVRASLRNWFHGSSPIVRLEFEEYPLFLTPKGETLPVRPDLVDELRQLRKWADGKATKSATPSRSTTRASTKPSAKPCSKTSSCHVKLPNDLPARPTSKDTENHQGQENTESDGSPQPDVQAMEQEVKGLGYEPLQNTESRTPTLQGIAQLPQHNSSGPASLQHPSTSGSNPSGPSPLACDKLASRAATQVSVEQGDSHGSALSLSITPPVVYGGNK